jgi:hypothetical protein
MRLGDLDVVLRSELIKVHDGNSIPGSLLVPGSHFSTGQ